LAAVNNTYILVVLTVVHSSILELTQLETDLKISIAGQAKNMYKYRNTTGKGKGHPITGHEGPRGGVEV
jgi:hypothetical protein